MNSIFKLILVCPLLIVPILVNAEDEGHYHTSLVELVAYNNGIATYSIAVCDEVNSKVSPDVVFSNVQPELAFAEIKLLVSNDRGMCAGGRKKIQVDVKKILASKAQEKGINSLSILLKSLPNRIELLNK